MKKISWIASYPKSGNTYLRLLLAAYFYSKNGIIKDFKSIDNILKISRFEFYKNSSSIPTLEEFIQDPKLISQYWLIAQKAISERVKTNLFIKTHDCMAKIRNKQFTNENFTKCFIYIIRDPRSVAVSYSHHMNYDYDKTIAYLVNKSFFIMYKKEEMTVPELVSSWAVHYNSWKSFLEKGNGLIIRYEDLINEPLTEFKKILVFLKQFISFEIDEVRLNNAVNTTRFKNIKNMEKTIGFKEKPKTSKEFFRKGQTSEWKKILNPKQIKIIESEFGQEMSDLNYF